MGADEGHGPLAEKATVPTNERSAKRKYQSPQLNELGSLTTLTRGMNGRSFDGNQNFNKHK